MQITLYRRTFPIEGSPFAVSFAPPDPAQRHTFTADGRVYEAEVREVLVIVPDGAKLDPLSGRLCWTGGAGPVKSNAREVLELARAKADGFKTVKS